MNRNIFFSAINEWHIVLTNEQKYFVIHKKKQTFCTNFKCNQSISKIISKFAQNITM